MAAEDIYRENILDHYKHPRNKGKIAQADAEAQDSNPLCGDEISIGIRVENKKIVDLKFDGSACAICIAAASMLTEEVKGKGLEEAKGFSKERLLSLLGIDPGPVRLKCALLPLKVLKLAIYRHLGKNPEKEDGLV
ncbi:MAG: SUF system NifU family Fe-S cluster assembly protein [Candidatus Micrarchaeota archaeon]|nr:SUF system NifU family Fe-S cluster assembly protein [Candidatus Micrarchaeota archaeon]